MTQGEFLESIKEILPYKFSPARPGLFGDIQEVRNWCRQELGFEGEPIMDGRSNYIGYNGGRWYMLANGAIRVNKNDAMMVRLSTLVDYRMKLDDSQE